MKEKHVQRLERLGRKAITELAGLKKDQELSM